jgi:hypothetical protein
MERRGGKGKIRQPPSPFHGQRLRAANSLTSFTIACNLHSGILLTTTWKGSSRPGLRAPSARSNSSDTPCIGPATAIPHSPSAMWSARSRGASSRLRFSSNTRHDLAPSASLTTAPSTKPCAHGSARRPTCRQQNHRRPPHASISSRNCSKPGAYLKSTSLRTSNNNDQQTAILSLVNLVATRQHATYGMAEPPPSRDLSGPVPSHAMGPCAPFAVRPRPVAYQPAAARFSSDRTEGNNTSIGLAISPERKPRKEHNSCLAS